MQGIKHLIDCRCILPQLKTKGILHKFVVFSIIDDSGEVQAKIAQCNNCGVLHKVIDICKSNILFGKENASALTSISEIKLSLSNDLCNILEKNNVDLPTWENAKFIIENKKWGQFVVLTTTTEDNLKLIKYLIILGENLFKVETATKEI
jgi:hypothetical protein